MNAVASPSPSCRIRLGQRYRVGKRTVRVVAVGPQFGAPAEARSWVLGMDDTGRQGVMPVEKFLRRATRAS